MIEWVLDGASEDILAELKSRLDREIKSVEELVELLKIKKGKGRLKGDFLAYEENRSRNRQRHRLPESCEDSSGCNQPGLARPTVRFWRLGRGFQKHGSDRCSEALDMSLVFFEGPAGSGKTTKLLEELRDQLASSPLAEHQKVLALSEDARLSAAPGQTAC